MSIVKYEINVMYLHNQFKRCTLLVVFINIVIFKELIYCSLPLPLKHFKTCLFFTCRFPLDYLKKKNVVPNTNNHLQSSSKITICIFYDFIRNLYHFSEIVSSTLPSKALSCITEAKSLKTTLSGHLWDHVCKGLEQIPLWKGSGLVSSERKGLWGF